MTRVALCVAVTVLMWGAVAPTCAEVRLAVIGASPGAFTAAAAGLGVRLVADGAAGDCEGLLVCAPQYPEVRSLGAAETRRVAEFLAAGKAVYLEYTPLAGVVGEAPRTAAFERLYCPAAELQAVGLPAFTVLEEHSSRYLPLTLPAGARLLLCYGRVAGLDRAVFGPPAAPEPALAEVAREGGRLLVAATALSNCERGRYKPTKAWGGLLRGVLLALLSPDSAARVSRGFLDAEAWTEPRSWAPPGEPVVLRARVPVGARVAAFANGRPLALVSGSDGWSSAPLKLPPGRHAWRVVVELGGGAA